MAEREQPDSGLWAEAEVAATRVGQVRPDAARRATATLPPGAVPVGGAGAGAASPARSGAAAPGPARPGGGPAHPPGPRPADAAAPAAERLGAFVALTRLSRTEPPPLLALPEPEPVRWTRRLLTLGLTGLLLAAGVALAVYPDLRAFAGAVTAGLRSQPGPARPPAAADLAGAVAPGQPPVPVPEAEVATVVVAGDIMLAGDIAARLGQPGDALYPFSAVAPLLRGADLTVASLESVIAAAQPGPDGRPAAFRAPPQAASTLGAAGFTAVSLATEPAAAAGPESLRETLAHLRAAGVGAFGAGENAREAQAPLVTEVKGTRIAFVGFSAAAGPGVAAEQAPGVLGAAVADLQAAVARARQEADFVIALAHWGPADQPAPDARQRQLARVLAEAGADVILGARPYVRQTVEFIGGRPVVYSLGKLAHGSLPGTGAAGGALARLRVHQGRLLGLELLEVPLGAGGAPEPARAPAAGRTWVEMSDQAVLRWRGDPAAERNDLISLDRLPAPGTCPPGRYRVVRVVPEGVQMVHEAFAGSQYWLTVAGDPMGCAGLPAPLLQALAQELAPGSQVVVPAGGI